MREWGSIPGLGRLFLPVIAGSLLQIAMFAHAEPTTEAEIQQHQVATSVVSNATKERLQLVPIKLLRYVGRSIEISYQLPCHARFFGIVALPQPGGTLRMAAALKGRSLICTSIPTEEVRLVDFIETTAYKVIAPMSRKTMGGRLVRAPIKDVRLVKIKKLDLGEERSHRLQIVYVPRCGVPLGTLIRRVDGQRLEVTKLERLARGQKTKDCPYSQRVAKVDALRLTTGQVVVTMAERTADLKRAYELRLAKVHKAVARGDRLSVEYRRRCDEAPIGVAVGRLSSHKKTMPLGMLVARYRNHQCSGKGKMRKAVHHSRKLFVPSGYRMISMKAQSFKSGLKIEAPNDFNRRPPRGKAKRKGGGFYVDYFHGCAKALGTIYRNGRDGLIVGLLSKPTSQTPCEKAARSISVHQPFVRDSVRLTDIHPMRLKGHAH